MNCTMKNIRRPLLLAICVALIPFITTKADDKQRHQLARQMSIYSSIINELNLFYVDSIMPEKMMKRSIVAMLNSLDPYTVYYSEEESDELKMMTTGKYAGIGSVIRYHTTKGTTVLAQPYEDMPAHKAGLLAGDLIISIDSKPVKGMSTDSVSEMLRGEPGTKLMLEIERPGKKETIIVKLERENIALPPISYYGMLDEKTGYILLESFTEGCAKKMRMAIVGLKKKGAKSFVIDLRGNGGGLINEAVEIVNLFIPKGKTIVTTKGKTQQANEEYTAHKEPIDTECMLAILVDGHSASASEIVAGALQDLDRAVIVGSRTFGKGLVQSSRPIHGGGILKLTTAKYYIPSGRCVQALDYSHMMDEGRSSRIPDSLTNVFYTQAGREVRDGGGIRPDFEPKTEELSTLLYYLMQDMSLFDFATEYKIKNDSIAPASDFNIDDTTYSEFCEYLKSRNFSYDLRSVKMLGDLKKMIDFEGLGDIVKEELKALEDKLQADLDYSLTHFRKEIGDMLADEIVKRYYGQQGSIVYSLREDNDIKEAQRIVNDRYEYSKILKPAPTDNTDKQK